MEKTKNYKNAYFSADTIKAVLAEHLKEEDSKSSYRLRRDNETWEFDDEHEFFAEYRKPHNTSTIRKYGKSITFSLQYFKDIETSVSVSANTRGEIERTFELFEEKYDTSVQEIEGSAKNPIVFIGHGRSPMWRDLKDHLVDKHGYQIEFYETGARAGHTIRDILEDMSAKSSFALLVMTGEDEGSDGTIKARPNVIHETGLFQGKLGFNRAIILLEDGTEEFSNLYGIQQLRFSKGNIKEVFGDVLATLKREFEN